MVQYHEMVLQQDAARTDIKDQSHSGTDKASGRDWIQMETQMIIHLLVIKSVFATSLSHDILQYPQPFPHSLPHY